MRPVAEGFAPDAELVGLPVLPHGGFVLWGG